MRKLSFLVLALLFCFPYLSPPQDTKWFVLIGQSNMVGMAELPDEQFTNNRIWNFSNAWLTIQAPLEPMDSCEGQVHEISCDLNAGYGASLQFARRLRAEIGGDIGLIPCAKFQRPIDWWLPDESIDTLYGSCLSRAKYVQEYLGEISGIVFWHGESDTTTFELADTWPVKVANIVRSFSNELGADLPMVYVQIASNPNDPRYPYWDYLRDVRQPVLMQYEPEAWVMVESLDMDLADSFHLTADSYYLMGNRIAIAMKSLLGY